MSIGPNLSFDKSFIESLNADESFWFDNLFMTNIIPVFYVETLADLEKQRKKGKVQRSAEDIVKEVADKIPIIGSVPNAYHRSLIISDLMGCGSELDEYHRPVITGGIYTASPNGDVHVSFKEFYETERLRRWKQHEFLDVEREVAQQWKKAISETDLGYKIDRVVKEIPNDLRFSNVEEVKKFTDEFINSKYNQFIYFVLDILDIPEKFRQAILKRWQQSRYTPFADFAPYAAFVLRIDLLFYISLFKKYLSVSHKNKDTNFIDLSYLYYLPFCLVFVSSDNFHKRLAPLFMDDNQMYIDGQDLKQDLKGLSEYYLEHKPDIDKHGSMKFATYPPYEKETLVGKIYDKYFKSWRENAKTHIQNLDKPIPKNDKTLSEIKTKSYQSKIYDGPPVSQEDLKSMSFSRMVPVQKGNWRILPEGIENHKKDE